MTRFVFSGRVRGKVVWGPKRSLAVLAMLLFGLSPIASAKGSNSGPGSVSSGRSGRPSAQHSRINNDKLDDELMRRKSANPMHKTRVIVRLVPGADLPSEFK